MIFRCIAPDWLLKKDINARRVHEGDISHCIHELNNQGYNIYFLPNYPSVYTPGTTVSGSHIDTFEFVYVDMDLKDGKWESKESFLEGLLSTSFPPTFIVDSGNGVHAYWQVSDLDGMSCLRICRRLLRLFDTDVAVGQIYQLMRAPGTMNTKNENDLKPCEYLYQGEAVYTCEQLDSVLPPISHGDEAYCVQHYNKTYQINQTEINVDETIPEKFLVLLAKSSEVRDIWEGKIDDRSAGDYRLGHLMYGAGFTKPEALSVLVNVEKAKSRAPMHRLAYATNIADKIWIFEEAEEALSSSVKDILAKGGKNLKGIRFPCHRLIDATHHGFRLGQVIGLVAGAGVGKTAMALNIFKWCAELNPDDYVHFFVPLEQPANEIADRWKTMCGDNTNLHDKVHVISNYSEDGSFRHLSLEEIKEYLLKFQKDTGKKAGCVVIDHIGVLKKKGKDGENQDLMDICHAMKAFAVQTNTLLVMQSQTSREKAGIGDLELNKDAAYGTMYFEAYCDYLMTIWQPLKRCYESKDCPTITAFKFCKIRHKKKNLDDIQEDIPYLLYFDSDTEIMRAPTQAEANSVKFFSAQATNKRKIDRKTDVVPYKSIHWFTGGENGNIENSSDPKGT